MATTPDNPSPSRFAMADRIAAKLAQLPTVDHNGRPLDEVDQLVADRRKWTTDPATGQPVQVWTVPPPAA